MKEENNIERLFQDAFEGFEVTPPPSVKVAIDQQIGGKRRGLGWLFGVLIVVFLGTAATWVVFHTNNTATTRQLAQTDVSEANGTADKKVSSIQSAAVAPSSSSNATTSGAGSQRIQSEVSHKWGKETFFNNSGTGKTIRPNQKNAKHKKNNRRTQKYSNSSGALSDGNVRGSAPYISEFIASTPKKNVPLDSSELSTVKPLAETTKDSTANTAIGEASKPSKDEKQPPVAYHWLVSINAGPSFGARTGSNGLSVDESKSFQLGGGIYRKVDLGSLTYAGVDLGYGKRTESYTTSIQVFDSIHYGIDSIPIYDSIVQDSVIGQNYFTTMDSIFSTKSGTGGSLVSSLSIGLSAQFNVSLKNNWGLSVTPAFNYALNTFKFEDATLGTVKVNSLQIKASLELYYDWRRLRFSAGINGRYEWIGTSSNPYLQDRKRWGITPMVGVGLKF